MKKKVLIISYYWPPAGGIGVHRCLKFAKYLPQFGWEPIVYAPSNARYEYTDESNFRHISPDLKIISAPIIEPFNAFRFFSGRKKAETTNPVYVRDKKRSLADEIGIWIRGNIFIPDARMFWIRPSVRRLKKYCRENKIDAILTNGPPHTNTVIALKLSRKLDIPWLADFQDPWTQVDYYKMLKIGKRADRKHKKLEQETFVRAKKITIASPTWARDLESIGAKNVDPIFWGYDEDDFPNETQKANEKFNIVHAGQLGYDRYPETFLRVLADLCEENPEFKEKLSIDFAGTVDYSIVQLIKDLDLEKNYNAIGKISFPEAIKLTISAQILLLPLNIADNAKGRIPGKLFENIKARRPILCLGPEGSDTQNIINETLSGESFEFDNYEGIKSFITSKFELFLNNKNILPEFDITNYSVKSQVKKLAEYLNCITKH
ncbi:MAG: glycosyltransferase family 4 protein [Bacteroidales bacterium]|nr:glycosyltransferase family 4 protein [Bacteroidales bacterium]